jgi:hypothetical protein
MAQKPLLHDEITSYLVDKFTAFVERPEVTDVWKELQRDTEAGTGTRPTIHRDKQEQLGKLPAVEIVFRGKSNEYRMTSSQEDTYNYDIIVTAAGNHPEWSAPLIRSIATSFESFLNQRESRQFNITAVPNTLCAYHSQAGPIDFDYRRGKGLKSAKISWMCKVFKPEHTTATVIP